MKIKTKIMIKRIIVSTLGSLLLGFGAGMTVCGNIGTDAFTMFVVALSDLFPVLTVGNWSAALSVVLIVITFNIDRKCIGYTTVAFALLGQFTIDLAINIIPMQDSLFGGIIVLILGIIVIALAVPIMSSGDMGFCAYDSLLFALSNRTKKPYKIFRYIFDACFLIAGFMLGGVIGVGTIICLLLTGYVIDTSVKILRPRLRKLVFKEK